MASQGGFTYAQLIAQARVLLQDQAQPYRYLDAELYMNLSEALGEARRLRPDLFLAYGLDAAPLVLTPANAQNTFPLDWRFYPAFVDFVTGRGETRDDTYTDDGRAAQLLARFVQRLMGVTV